MIKDMFPIREMPFMEVTHMNSVLDKLITRSDNDKELQDIYEEIKAYFDSLSTHLDKVDKQDLVRDEYMLKEGSYFYKN